MDTNLKKAILLHRLELLQAHAECVAATPGILRELAAAEAELRALELQEPRS